MLNKKPQIVLITGATGAIGSALVRYYARAGVKLIIQGRSQDQLASLAEDCRASQSEVETVSLDLTDRVALSDWMDALLQETVPDLVIANAGMNIDIGPEGRGESWEATERLLELNVRATCYIAHKMASAMRKRGKGRLVLISSLAAWFGLPVTPAYSASKAAVKAYGEALSGWLHGSGVSVTVVMPGYVRSAMCDAMPGPKPFLWQPERAARHIAERVAKGRVRVCFPFPLSLGCWLLAVLPAGFSYRLLRLLGYGG